MMHMRHTTHGIQIVQTTRAAITANITATPATIVIRAATCVGHTAVNRMLIEQRHARKSLGTLLTPVLLHIAVSLHVSPQIGAIGECARTNVTLERLLARVRSHVTL